MQAQSESLVEERVAKLEAISQRRNELLIEMYQLMQRRHKFGSTLTLDDGNDEDLQRFLEKFDLNNNPESGSVASLVESDLLASSPEPQEPPPPEKSESPTELSPLAKLDQYTSPTPEPSIDDATAETEEVEVKGFVATAVLDADLLMQVEVASSSSSPTTAPNQELLVHSMAVEVFQLHTPTMIPKPSSPITEPPAFNFDGPLTNNDTLRRAPLQTQHHFNQQYTLPSLKSLPVEYHRKGKSAKQRKRDRDREKNDKDKVDPKKEGRDEWAPMGPNKWGATIRANPLWKKVSRATKCLSTRDWSVAMSELRLTRTLDRVESMKDAGKWSFRQPKKQRGVGGLTKSHWDHLLDEMKWMRIDFREERRWKFVLAFNLSTAVLEWHAAGTREVRQKLGICVLWKRPRALEVDTGDDDIGSSQGMMNTDPRPTEQMNDDYTPMDEDSDNEDDEPEQERRNIVDALETTNVIDDAIVSATQTTAAASQPQDTAVELVQPKLEDIEHSFVLQENADNETGDAMDVDGQTTDDAVGSISKVEETATTSLGLKSGSSNPVLASQSQHDSENAGPKITSRTNIHTSLREQIAYSDLRKLFLGTDDLDIVKSFSKLSTSDQVPEPSVPPPDLSEIFPDLQPLGMLGVAPVISSSENKKKGERRSDRDDPNKRSEDTTYTKLVPIGRFMHCKPTLLGPLQPAKHWKNGKWIHMDEPSILAEHDVPLNKGIDEISSALFDGNKPSNPSMVNPIALPAPPKEPKRRGLENVWSVNEDSLLKSLAEKYPNNWGLIADAFNSSRVTISTDKRTPWDCLDRWGARFAPQTRIGPSAVPPDVDSPAIIDGTPPPINTTGPPAQVQMTTRGVKRLATANVAAASSPVNGSGQGSDTKKRRRHALMYETMRKAAKKRETAQKALANQRKPSAVHDTHGQYNKLPKYTPAELSRMKGEKEAREQQEYILARRKQEEMARQQFSRMQGIAVSQQAAIQQQQQQQQQQPQTPGGGAPRPAAAVPQNVPQIRTQQVQQVNISQQQRIPTPLIGTPRMSPQQMLQAQAAQQARAIAAAAQVQAQAQAQAQGANITTNINGATAGAHLSPPYNGRASTSSPAIPHQASPPRGANTPNVTNSPRPTSAQALVGVGQTSQVPGNAAPRPASSIPAHYMPIVQGVQGGQFTQEQMEQAMRLQTYMAQQAQAQRQAAISQANQNNQYHPQN